MQVVFPVASSKGNISNPALSKLHVRRIDYNFISSAMSNIRDYTLDATYSLEAGSMEYIPQILSRISVGMSQSDGSSARARTDTGIIAIVVHTGLYTRRLNI